MGNGRTYKIGEDVYDIPDNEVDVFVKENPSAMEVNSFVIDKDTFDIPLPEVEAFVKENPTAKSLKKKTNIPFDSSDGQSLSKELNAPVNLEPTNFDESRTKVIGDLKAKSEENTAALQQGLNDFEVQAKQLQEQFKQAPTPELEAQINDVAKNYKDTKDAYEKEAFAARHYAKRIAQQEPEDEGVMMDLYNSFAAGSAKLGSSLANTPSFIYDVFALPQNLIAQYTGANVGTSAGQFAQEMGIPKNQVANYYDKLAEEAKSKINEKYQGSATEAIEKGDYSTALRTIANQVAESAPISISLAVGNAAGVAPLASTIGGSAVFGAEKKAELDETAPLLDEATKTSNALATGLFEGIFEQFGVTKLGDIAKNIVKTEGKEAAKKTIENGFKEVYSPLLKKYLGVGAEESIGEMATQFAQNATDKYSGYKPDLELTDGVIDAGLVGIGSSAAFSAPVASAEIFKSKKLRKQAAEISENNQALENDIANPNITDDVKEILKNEIQASNEKLADLHAKDKAEIEKVSEENKAIISDNSKQIDALTISLQDENISDESKKIIESKINDLENDNEKLIKSKDEKETETKETEVLTEKKPNESDKTDTTRLESDQRIREEPVKTEPIESASNQEIETGGNVQASPEEEIKPAEISDKETTGGEKIEETPESRKTVFNALRSKVSAAKTKSEVQIAIEEFVKANKDRFEGLSEKRIMKLLTNAAEAGATDKANTFIRRAEKILIKQERINKVKKSETLQNEVKKKTGIFTNIRKGIKEFINIDADELSKGNPKLFNKYISALEGLSKRGVKSTEQAQNLLDEIKTYQAKIKPRKVTGMNAVIGKYNTIDELRTHIDDLLTNKLTDLESLKQVARELSMIGTRANELVVEANASGNANLLQEFNDFIENELPSKFSDNVASKDLQAAVEQLKSDVVDKAKSVKLKTGLFGIRDKAVKIFDSWTKEDLMRLNPSEILTYEGVVNEVNARYIPPQLHDLNNKIQTLKNIESLKTDIQEAATSFNSLSKASKKISNLLSNTKGETAKEVKEKLLTIGKQYWDDMFGTSEKKSVWRTLIYPTSKAFVESQKNTAEDLKEFNEALKGVKGFNTKHISDRDTKNYKKTMSKLGIILAQLDFQSNFIGWENLPNADKDLFSKLISNPSKIGSLDKKKLGLDKEAYAELVKLGAVKDGLLNPELAISKLPENEKKVIEAFQKLLESEKDKALLMTEKRGDPFNEQVNYFPRHVLTDYKEGLDESVNSALALANVSLGGNVGTRASATKQRAESAVNYYNFNLEQVARKHARQINQDFYLTDAIKQAMGTLSGLAKNYSKEKNFEMETQILGMKDAIEQGLKQELSSQYMIGQADPSIIRHGIELALKSARNLTLSNPTRILTEGLSNMVRNMSFPTSFSGKEAPLWDNITNELGSSVFLKGGKWSMENREASNTTLGSWNNIMMQFADSVNAKQMWVDTFNKSFKEQTGFEFKPEMFNDEKYRDKYSAQIEKSAQEAELDINKYYNAQTGFTAPSHIKIAPFTKGISRDNVSAKIFGYMNSFAANETTMSRMALKNIAEGDYSKGFAQLGRLVASNYAFVLFSTFVGGALKGIFDDEDDNVLESALDPFSEDAFENGFLSTMFSMTIGKYSNMFRLSSGFLLGALNKISPDSEVVNDMTKTAKEVAYIKPFLLSSTKQDPKGQFDYVMENVAPGLGMATSDMIEGLYSFGNVGGAIINDEEIKASDLYILSRSGLYGLSLLTGGLPAGALFNKSLKAKTLQATKEEKEESTFERELNKQKEAGYDNNEAKKRAKNNINRSTYRNELKRDGYNDKTIKEKVDKKYPPNTSN